MPDFDDDFDRRHRDKFARERDRGMRSDYGQDRRFTGANSIGIKRGPVRRDDEPSMKRNRFDAASDTYEPQFNKRADAGARTMLTFKKFLETQDESISDEEAISKYNEYKLEYRKQEFEKFFAAHKDEEWFQIKYHPTLSRESEERFRENLQKRLNTYNELTGTGAIGSDLRLDYDNCEAIIKFMDAVVIRLEGGTQENIDLMLKETINDESLDEARKKQAAAAKSGTSTGGEVANTSASNGTAKSVAGGEAEESSQIKALLKTVTYKTHSLFFRNVPPTARIEDIETECKNYPGFLRLCLSEPLPDQKFTRRLWVTFRRDVNIKDIFWKMKSAKFADGDVQASVNRDLRRRIRFVNGTSLHRPAVQSDIRQAARLIALFDYKRKLFASAAAPAPQPTAEGEAEPQEAAASENGDGNEDEPKETGEKAPPPASEPPARPKDLDALVAQSKNPVLDGVFEHFVEETSAEEEELLGVTTTTGDDLKVPLEIDRSLIAYLDKLLVYLRVVHSVDFYNHCEYANEDSMPNRMGMMHIRDVPPSGADVTKNEAGATVMPKKIVDAYISNVEERLKSSILKYEAMTDYELIKLGKRDAEQVLENFINENCVEVAKDKWLCPLSGKKFKGPEFIRKHLFSKHEQKLDEIKAEATYYNNYINDPDRPHNAEPKTQNASTSDDQQRRLGDDKNSPALGGHRGWGDRAPPRITMNRFGGGARADFPGRARWAGVDDFGTGGPRRDPRQPASYRDLDAPPDDAI